MQAHDGEEALKKNASFQPDLILLDIMLPGIDGYQVCREIRVKNMELLQGFLAVIYDLSLKAFFCEIESNQLCNVVSSSTMRIFM